ncbi:type II toxin-antitoxin system Phd/YefM family antitoxin [Methyloraptor flagellatus]|uniref:Antitoxin n=1 Tax=Methyloraptor flagellatus TaxID=3162530 RepID=A0AAU7XGQ3_9HYPH
MANRNTRTPPPRASGRWPLQTAKARLSEVVRAARTEGPQRVTVHGQDAVVVVAAEDFEGSKRTGADLVAALSGSPLAEVEFERTSFKAPMRDVSL